MIQSVQLAGLKIMTGHRQVEQAALFYEFSLERHTGRPSAGDSRITSQLT